jgi:hypothetical protein
MKSTGTIALGEKIGALALNLAIVSFPKKRATRHADSRMSEVRCQSEGASQGSGIQLRGFRESQI